MKYSEMVKQAVNSGGGEAMMWKSVERVDCLLEKMKDEEPGKYWDFIRKAHEDMYGEHFDKQFAEYEVSQMYATDKDGHGLGLYIARTLMNKMNGDLIAESDGKGFAVTLVIPLS